MDVFGVSLGARQIIFPQRDSQKRRPEASGTKIEVRNAGKMPAVRKLKSKTAAVLHESFRTGWLEDFELAFAIGR